MTMRLRHLRLLPTLLLLGFLCAGCASESFALRPGFTEYFNQYPPEQQQPDKSAQALLQKYRPRIYKAQGQQGPVDFYRQYISSGILEVQGKRLSTDVTAQQLNQYRDNPDAMFQYTGKSMVDADATVYARIDTDTLTYQGKSFDFQFLTYNLVFPTSGLIEGMGLLSSVGLEIIGNLTDWHQLDHYVGLSVVLMEQRPLALMLQQHNYQTTYLFGTDLQLPDDNRVAVDIAMRSNELYLHSEAEQRHPAVSFVSAKNLEFIKTGRNKPVMAGYDITRGEYEIDYTLQTLPQTDAFYQFKGHLGKLRLLPGRDGPPGADYVTLPGLMPRAIRLVSGYRPGSVERESAKSRAMFNEETFSINIEALDAFKQDFLEAAGLLP